MPYQIYQTFLDIYNIKRQPTTPMNTNINTNIKNNIKTPMNTNIKTPMNTPIKNNINTPYWEFFTAWI